MTLPRYQELKDSGIDYLGAIPSTWSIKRLGDIVSFAQGKAHEPYIDDDGDYICVNSRFVSTAGKTLKKCTVNLTPASLNDILMVMSDLPNGRALARAYYVRDNGKYAVNQRVCRITAEKADSSFLFYLLDRHPGLMQNDDGVHQTHLSNDDFLKLKLYLPSFSEQIQIARFLDHETARIDALIEEQQRLIELLKEKRQAVISHAVTKGLDPTVPMKDSGVEWLGEVPAHWEVTKLSFITSRIGSGKTPSGGADAYVADGVTFIRSQNVYDEGLRLDDCVFIDEATDLEMAGSRVRPLDVLINITGASIGRTCIVPEDFGRANVNQHVCVIRLSSPKKNAAWVSEALKATPTKHQVDISQTGAAREGLNFEQLAGFWICVPPLGEMAPILAHIRQMRAVIGQLLNEAEASVNLLKERRSALISAAVTGKIDVRNW